MVKSFFVVNPYHINDILVTKTCWRPESDFAYIQFRPQENLNVSQVLF